jgi:hypothetical protein
MIALGIDASSQVENFERYEFKYLLSKDERDEIEDEISHFMTYDGHVHPEFENSYIVRSLYFDNAESANYYEKIDGIKTRHKFRIRTYGTDEDESVPIFLEEKGRHNNRTYKQRIRIRSEDLKIAEDSSRAFELLDLYPNVPLIESFIFDIERRRLEAKVLVDYIRRPYSSPYDMNFRITFDSALSAASVDRLFPTSVAPRYLSNAGWTILEVKFLRRIPAWFHRILQAHSLSRLSISKFCKGMEICGHPVDLS